MEPSIPRRLGAPAPRFRGLARLALPSLGLALLAGCLTDDDDDDDDTSDGTSICESPQYGDGTCNADLDCDAPDIDCFRTFSSQEEVESWYAAFEELLAAEELRPPRAIIPSTDPRFIRMRGLLDQGWDAYRERFPLADLADESPGLVLLEDASINAFVISDLESGRSALAVMVHSAVLDAGVPDDEMLGLVMHELAHAVRLHLIAGGKDAVRRFYSVEPGAAEPLGFEQDEDPIARRHGGAWRAAAEEAGPYSSAELGGLPFLRTPVSRILASVLNPFAEENAGVCAAPMAALGQLGDDLLAQLGPLDGALTLDPADGWRTRADTVLAGLRDTCMATYEGTFVEAAAELSGVSPEALRAALDESDLALVEGVHLVDAVAALIADRRSRMRAAEQAFTAETARPWSALRYFSYEEDADDTTVPVLREMGRQPAANGDFLIRALGDRGSLCRDVLDTGDTPPYGADLHDEHHATCWRAFHARQLAAAGDARKASGGDQTRRASTAPTGSRRGLRLPPTLRDRVIH
jgi:hypothetical protein